MAFLWPRWWPVPGLWAPACEASPEEVAGVSTPPFLFYNWIPMNYLFAKDISHVRKLVNLFVFNYCGSNAQCNAFLKGRVWWEEQAWAHIACLWLPSCTIDCTQQVDEQRSYLAAFPGLSSLSWLSCIQRLKRGGGCSLTALYCIWVASSNSDNRHLGQATLVHTLEPLLHAVATFISQIHNDDSK